MSRPGDLLLLNARPWGGALCNVVIQGGIITHLGKERSSSGQVFDCEGGTLLPGLHDHHIHILATAAREESVDLSGLTTETAVRRRLQEAASAAPDRGWLRAVAYDERAAGLPTRDTLDAWAPAHALRLQDRTGALWVLNSRALGLLGPGPLPAGCERTADGAATGRFWREDAWLAGRLPSAALDLARLGRSLSAMGVTGVTDAGAANNESVASLLSAARRDGALPQRLTLMGPEGLRCAEGCSPGPVKLLIDERAPPDPEQLAFRIDAARRIGRNVAAHCVTRLELALYFAALDSAGGARPGDRVEHGGEITPEALAVLAASPLTVVTNPGFLRDRGDRYIATTPPEERRDLYRAASLKRAGIRLAAGSDAPYGQADPWRAMQAATDRRTMSGQQLGGDERLDARTALGLFMGPAGDPGGPARAIAMGAVADLILLDCGVEDALAELSGRRVAATVIGGRVVFTR